MTNDRDKKRPGTFMGDDERALEGLERRRRVVTPVHGVPVDEFDDDQPTPPPQDVNKLIKVLWPLRHADEWLTEVSSDIAALKVRADHLEEMSGGLDDIGRLQERITDATGKSGDNGKLGELRRRVDAWTSKMWWFITALVGMVGTAAVKLVLVTRAFDAVEADARQALEQTKILQVQVMTLQAAAISRSRSGRGDRVEAPGSSDVPAAPGKD